MLAVVTVGLRMVRELRIASPEKAQGQKKTEECQDK